jgi:ELWxxDGT repeat protein
MGAIRGWLGRGALAGAACIALALPAAAQGAGASDGTTGVELYKTDGTVGGTTLVKDLNPGGADSSPDQLTAAGGLLFFTADDGSGIGAELYRSDGTAAGTTLVEDIHPGVSTSFIDNLTAVGGSVFFSANDGAGAGFELFPERRHRRGHGAARRHQPIRGQLPRPAAESGWRALVHGLHSGRRQRAVPEQRLVDDDDRGPVPGHHR